jgi:tetratricopeptide (TPR) repeat protein
VIDSGLDPIVAADAGLPPGTRVGPFVVESEIGRGGARYPSVEALRDDLVRYREGLPIRATAPGPIHRARKFVGRHRVGVLATSLVVLAIGAGAVSTWVQSQHVAREAAVSQRVKEFLVELFRSSDPDEARGDDLTARELLARGVERVEGELQSAPLAQAELLQVLGTISRELGDYQNSRRLLESAIEARLQSDPSNEVALAMVRSDLARTLTDLEEYDQAKLLGVESLDTLRSKLGVDDRTLKAATTLVIIYGEHGDYSAAEPIGRQALEMSRELHGTASREFASACVHLASALAQLGTHDEADALFRQAIELSRTHGWSDDLAFASTLSNFAASRVRIGASDEAVELFREALTIRRRYFPENDASVAEALSNLAASHLSQKNLAEAEPLFEEALAMRKAVFGEEHAKVAMTMSQLALLYFATGREALGERLLRDAALMQDRVLGAGNVQAAVTWTNLGGMLLGKGRFADAIPPLERAVPALRAALPAGHPNLTNAIMGLGRSYLGAGRTESARPLIEEAVASYEALYGADDARTQRARGVLDGLPPRSR